MCGWAIQTKLVTQELRRRGHVCDVLKINENRKIKDSAYIDVQGGWDYFLKVLMHSLQGYRLNVHVNGMSKKGYLLALAAVLAGRLTLRPARLTFHGGLGQDYFPRPDSGWLRLAFRCLFQLAGGIACDSQEIRRAIIDYGIAPDKVTAIATFSTQYVTFQPAMLSTEVDAFFSSHHPVFFCYVSFRPEYRLDVLREGMNRYRAHYPKAGFIWLGFPAKEIPMAQNFIKEWPSDERQSLLLLGNLTHDQFLTLMTRSYACLRTPACDGVAASVLEALALGIPVVASENGRRPEGVISYDETSAEDMSTKLQYLTEHYEELKSRIHPVPVADNIAMMADWLCGQASSGVTHAG
jgi:glycosyltransferase involved in cell wall biosynthesis